jgi:SNF2 family DNA or RNA helicase
MRPYQLQGLNWLVSLHHNSLNGILADEMVCSYNVLSQLQSIYNRKWHRVWAKPFKPYPFLLI